MSNSVGTAKDRARLAERLITAGCAQGRDFDGYFESGDGDEVVYLLAIRLARSSGFRQAALRVQRNLPAVLVELAKSLEAGERPGLQVVHDIVKLAPSVRAAQECVDQTRMAIHDADNWGGRRRFSGRTGGLRLDRFDKAIAALSKAETVVRNRLAREGITA